MTIQNRVYSFLGQVRKYIRENLYEDESDLNRKRKPMLNSVHLARMCLAQRHPDGRLSCTLRAEDPRERDMDTENQENTTQWFLSA